ncbi:hypothetical protein PanWU01x14_223270 [Parasponia andersonii]|uniref:Uncharacterized protein n=1 Tax=Parasponia andersonii TaxID=3476 RepID=A0A2P5BNU6_PARAD|nr:hypothetical protein PanWU01x14_223270 [Parasponia andersonii]
MLRNDLLELFDFLLEILLGEFLLGQVLEHLLLFQVEGRSLLLPSLFRVLECLCYFINFLSFLYAFENRIVDQDSSSRSLKKKKCINLQVNTKRVYTKRR